MGQKWRQALPEVTSGFCPAGGQILRVQGDLIDMSGASRVVVRKLSLSGLLSHSMVSDPFSMASSAGKLGILPDGSGFNISRKLPPS